jgi:hypothetical protein
MPNGRDGSLNRPFTVAARPAVTPNHQTTYALKLLARAGSLASVKCIRFNFVTF